MVSSLWRATNARRFDVSPAWQAWVGAEHAIELFAGLDMREVWERTSGLGDALCEALGIPPLLRVRLLGNDGCLRERLRARTWVHTCA